MANFTLYLTSSQYTDRAVSIDIKDILLWILLFYFIFLTEGQHSQRQMKFSLCLSFFSECLKLLMG